MHGDAESIIQDSLTQEDFNYSNQVILFRYKLLINFNYYRLLRRN